MPKTHRDLINRTLAQAYININWAGKYLAKLKEEFQPVHPELANILNDVLEGLAIETEVLEMFAKQISGRDTIDWQAWAATGRPRQTDTMLADLQGNTSLLEANSNDDLKPVEG